MTLRRHCLSLLALAVLLAAPGALAQHEQPVQQGEAKAVPVQPLSDEAVKDFLKAVAAALEADAKAAAENPDTPRRSAAQGVLSSSPYIARGLDNNRATSDEQVKTIVAELTALKEKYPSAAGMIDREIFKVSHLSIGRKAPNIKGIDTDEVEFQLTDYRGKVVVIDFWGDW